jgi:glycosyltransferase involved in cell wall biosynthesis/predicted Zn-dependent protease
VSENRLSLCMIVRNEEAHMRECLAAASEFADEMIVVDTGSTDRTVEIAHQMGARVSVFPWTGDFSAARNASLAHATGDWVLYLDADERMDFFNGARLQRFLESAGTDVPGFCLRIESEARHRHSGVWMSHYYPRVFRRAPGVRFEGALHEQVFDSEGPVCTRAPRLPVVIQHLGYADLQKESGRRARNVAIVEEEARRCPDDPILRRKLANALLGAGDCARAREIYAQLLQEPLPDEFLQQVRWNLCICGIEAGDFREARAALDPGDRTYCALLLRAEIERRTGNIEEAVQILQGILDAPPADTQAAMDFRAEPVHVRIQLALCERSRGYPARARNHLEEALRLSPQSPEARLELANLDENAGEMEAALAHLAVVSESHPQLEDAHLSRFRVLMALGRPHQARAALEAGLEHLPGHADMRRLLETMSEDENASRGAVSNTGLSVCMIVRDAEGTLGRALGSVRGVADEIVVVDTGSADGTVELARSHGAVVLESPWREDFSTPRNLGLARARGPWVLVLDSDEELDPASVPELLAVLGSDRSDAAEVAIANRLRSDDAVNGISHRYCRLFRKLPGVRFEGRVHEQVLPSLLRSGARLAKSGIRILHSGYGLDPEALRAKQERNLGLLHRELAERPGDRFLLFHLGVTLFALGRNEDAAIPLQASLEGRSLPPEALSLAHVKLAQIALAHGDRALAREHLEEAEAARPRSALVTYLRAGIEFSEQAYAKAAELLQQLLAPEGGLSCEESLDEGTLRLDHGNCLYYLGRFEQAISEYRRAAALDPDLSRAHYNLGNALYQAGQFGEALRSFDRALSLDPSLEAAQQNAWQCTLRLAELLEREGRDAELAGLDVTGAPRDLRRLVAAAQLRSGRCHEALLELEALRRGDRTDDGTALLLGAALRESGRVAEGLELLGPLATAYPDDPRVLSQYALTLFAAGRAEEAGRAGARALELDPSLAASRAA